MNVAELARSSRVTAVRNFTGAGAEERAYSFAQWFVAGPLAAVRQGSAQVEGARRFCLERGLTLERAHSSRENAAGGFLVPAEFLADFIDLRERYGVFRRNARVVKMTREQQDSLRRRGGLVAYPLGVERSAPESEARWDGVHLDAKRWGVLTRAEAELSEDAATNFGDELAGEMAYAFARSEDECGFVGDGSSDFHGVAGVTTRLRELDAAVANVAGLVEASGDEWDGITLADMRTVVGRLPEYADTADARWYCSRRFWADVMLRLIGGAAGEAAALAADVAPRKRFLGYPVEVAQVLPRKSEASQIPCLLGDLRQAARFGDRKQVAVAVTESNRTEFAEDLLTIRGVSRFDINVHDVGDASADEDEREAGPVLGLITKAA
jgi:HK97 family phage major capsid protein